MGRVWAGVPGGERSTESDVSEAACSAVELSAQYQYRLSECQELIQPRRPTSGGGVRSAVCEKNSERSCQRSIKESELCVRCGKATASLRCVERRERLSDERNNRLWAKVEGGVE